MLKGFAITKKHLDRHGGLVNIITIFLYTVAAVTHLLTRNLEY